MAVPVISNLPPAPTRSDGPADFTPKADAMIGALQPMVVQVNIALQWMAGQLTETQAQAAAAAASALAAADSATAANASKNAAAQSAIDATTNGAAQVTLAANQVTLAVSAKNSAEVAAAAAQAAAGLPSLAGNAYKVLRVNSGATGVEWGLGLPTVVGVAVGKTLAVGAGNTVSWVEQYKVGDLLLSARNPGALWLTADGSIRAQSSYPVLFATLGLIGSAVGVSWNTVSVGLAQLSIAASETTGTVIALRSDGSVTRSTNRGATFTLQPATRGSTTSIATDGAGTWIITTSATAGTAYRSTDDGLTWSSITLPSTGSGGWVKSVYAGNNIWVALAGNANSNIARSSDGGSTWTSVSHGFGGAVVSDIASDKSGVCVAASGTAVRRSSDFGATWSAVLTAAASIAAVSTDSLGTWLISGSNGQTSSYLSKTNGLTFTLVPMPAEANVNSIVYANQTFILQIVSGFMYSFDGSIFTQLSGAPSGIIGIAHAGGGLLVGRGTAPNIQRSLPYTYDPSTQFQLPRQISAVGLTAYIKALEAA